MILLTILCLLIAAPPFGIRQLRGQHISWPDPVANDVLPYATAGLSHGPLLGGVTDRSVKVWVRTRVATEFGDLYGPALPLNDESAQVIGKTTEESDLTGSITLTGLRANTRYYYAIRINGVLPDLRPDVTAAWPSFKTLPNKTSYVDVANNPNGLFNVTFAVGHCAAQDPDVSGGMYTSTPAYDMIRKHHVYEMMCGPFGSTGHPLETLGNPPTGGKWSSMGRDVQVRWVSGFPNNLPYQKIRNTYYGIVQVNNLLKVASPDGGYQFSAYDEPQVVVRWHDGYTGRLVYAESITVGDAK